MRGRRQRASSPLRHPLRSRGLQCPRRPLPSHSPTAAHSVPTECSLTPALAGRATRHRHHAQPARSPSSPLRIPWPTLPLHLGSPLQHKSAFATLALTLLTPPWCLNRRPKRPVLLRSCSALPSGRRIHRRRGAYLFRRTPNRIGAGAAFCHGRNELHI